MAQTAPSTDGQRTTREPSLAPIDPTVSPSTPTESTSAAPPPADATPPGETADSADGDSVEDTLVVADAAAPPLPELEEWLNFTVKWSGKTYDVRVSTSDLVFDLRTQLESLTSVPPDAQKILGLGRGKLSADADGSRIGTLTGVRDGAKLTMVGTPEHLRFKYDGPPPEAEFDFAYPAARPANVAAPTALSPAQDPRNLRCVEQIIKTKEITVMNDPRPGKRLLVLDLDYSGCIKRGLYVLTGKLLPTPAHCSTCPNGSVYPHYDIVVWSQTHWMWLESKLVELGVLGGTASYKICFVADRTSMFPIFSQRGGQMVKHEVKPLAYFWAKFPQWSPKNTVHIDDLARNFALNAGSGLKIRAFKGAGTPNGLRDRELDKLGNYLVDITAVDDFTTLDHTRWKKRRTARADADSSDPPDVSGSTGDNGGSARAGASGRGGGGDGGGGAS